MKSKWIVAASRGLLVAWLGTGSCQIQSAPGILAPSLFLFSSVMDAAGELRPRTNAISSGQRMFSARRAQLPFQHRNEEVFPSPFLSCDGFAGVEPFFRIKSRLRLTQAQDAPAIGQLEQEQINVAFLMASLTSTAEFCQREHRTESNRALLVNSSIPTTVRAFRPLTTLYAE